MDIILAMESIIMNLKIETERITSTSNNPIIINFTSTMQTFLENLTITVQNTKETFIFICNISTFGTVSDLTTNDMVFLGTSIVI